MSFFSFRKIANKVKEKKKKKKKEDNKNKMKKQQQTNKQKDLFKIRHQLHMCFFFFFFFPKHLHSPVWVRSKYFWKALNSLNSGNWGSEVISSVEQKALRYPSILEDTLHLYRLLKISMTDWFCPSVVAEISLLLLSVLRSKAMLKQENDGNISKLLKASWA